MTSLSRQNTLFVSEDWLRIYEALTNIDFRSYDFNNFISAIVSYLRIQYPEEYNDWIPSSEFIAKVDILAWLSQNIAFRMDLNSREVFLGTANRKESLIKLAQNVAYKVNRVKSASGFVKIISVETTENVIDSNNLNIKDRQIVWNDPTNEDWYEQFVLVLNSALSNRTKVGRPLNSIEIDNQSIQQYILKSVAPSNGSYSFSVNVNGDSLSFDITNSIINENTKQIEELPPIDNNQFNMFFKDSGNGLTSHGTGFYFYIKQGNLTSQSFEFIDPIISRSQDIFSFNINNDDFFLQELNSNNEVVDTWIKIDNVYGEGVFFTNTQTITDQNISINPLKIYELDTLDNDKVRVRFGDGTFGLIPVGNFRVWYRSANPNATIVTPNAIQKQIIVIPYVSNNNIEYLTVSFSLEDSLVNAAASETNLSIRSRANKMFYTQNRMITGQDYNNFFLKDTSIAKVKTVNRTFSGASRYSKLNDQTSLYKNLKAIGNDGRFYEEDTESFTFVSANTSLLAPKILIEQYLKPIISKTDKKILYFNKFGEQFLLNRVYTWSETSIIANQSRGNIKENNTKIPVNDTGSGNFKLIDTDAVIRYGSIDGPLTNVVRVTDDGTNPDGIILGDVIPNNSRIISVFPAFRDSLNDDEVDTILSKIEAKVNFGITWNQNVEGWVIISSDNLSTNTNFSLENQGDNTNSFMDASWLIRFEYIPDGIGDSKWKIVDRGRGLFFESAKEVDFIFANSDPIIDPETGNVVYDSIQILGSNESRDSLRRRGLLDLANQKCDQKSYTFIGDGVTKCFATSEIPLFPQYTVVIINNILQINGTDYTIETSVKGDKVCFLTAPAIGDFIEIRVSGVFINATIRVKHIVADGIHDEYELDSEIVSPTNAIVFIDGITQKASLDFGIGQIGNKASIILTKIFDPGVSIVIHYLSETDNNIISRFNFVGDGTTTEFTLTTLSQNSDTLFISVDGVLQSPNNYTIHNHVDNTVIQFNDAPEQDVKIRILSVTSPLLARTKMFSYTGDGITNSFPLTGLNGVQAENVMVAIEGVLQEGSYSTNSNWSITGGNTVLFNIAPLIDKEITIFVILGAVGTICANGSPVPDIGQNLGKYDVSSCQVHYIGQDIPLIVEDVIRHDDGYVNTNGLFVKPSDVNNSGFFDNPFIFKDIVLTDGFTDLVLWRQIEQDGFSIWEPISALTNPKGTYGSSALGMPKANDPVDLELYRYNDIHYDIISTKWLIADETTTNWLEASNQSLFKKSIGRDNIRFLWTHYSPNAHRIDPSVSNIMDVYILPSTYDDAYRTWILNNGDTSDEPSPPSSESLRIQYQNFSEFKANSDSIIFHPARYKPLFGTQAVQELQATFKAIKTPGSTISDNDLRLNILNSINTFFSLDLWNFGDKFYFTELASYIQTSLAPNVQSIVIVPKKSTQAFGRLFQVRAEPDELLISAAGPEDIEIVTNLSDEEIRIGTLS